MTARAAGRRSKSCMSEFLWTLLLCGLLTDADMNRLRNRYLSPRRNRVAPRQFVARATELVPPSWVPLDRLEAFLEDIARSHPPEPLLSRDDADRDLRGLALSRSVTSAAALVWNALWSEDEEIAPHVCREVENLMGPQPYDPLVDDVAEVVSDQVRRALDTLNLPGTIGRLEDRLGALESRLQERFESVSSALGRLATSLEKVQDDVHRLSKAPQTRSGSRHEDLERLARAVQDLLESQTSPPPWARQLGERLDHWEKRVKALERSLLRGDWIRARRAAWLEAHPGAPLRIGLVADCANLYFGAVSWKGRHVDMARLKETLGGGGQVVSAVAFAVQPRHADAASYFDTLRFAGWHVEARAGKPAGEAGERWKSNWDVGITLHVVRQAPLIDVLGIATGDGDFADLLRWLRARGIRSRVASLPGVASHILREEADEFIEIDESMLLSGSA